MGFIKDDDGVLVVKRVIRPHGFVKHVVVGH